MNYTEVMHILQPIRNASQLGSSSVGFLGDQVATYKLGPVYIPVPLDEVVDVSILHPIGN